MLWSRREVRKAVGGAPERRTAPRLDKVFRVYLEGERGAGLGIARNISEGGMFVETRAPQPIGTMVRIVIPSDAGEMAAVAEVRYVCHLLARSPDAPERGPLAMRGMGIRFLYFELDGFETEPRMVRLH
ncbi:MAG TPA: PilZ domain-containing protein [Anaeromyxobacter sp.]|nr:PilZ domain-containing protein [Anaeromyxobacter sp.]